NYGFGVGAESPCPPVPMSLLVSERLDRIQPRRLEGGIHSEEDADRCREPEADRKRPPRQRDREPRRRVNGPADSRPEDDADQSAERRQERRFHQKLKEDPG